MTLAVTTLGSTMPFPTVCATLSPKTRKAMKLKNDAQNTASDGRSTRVETMVAIELAASCSPFRKSNSRAVAMRPISNGVAREAVNGAAFGARWQDVEGTAAIMGARQQTFVLEVGDVFVDGGEGAEVQTTGDLVKRGRIAVALHKAGDELQHFLLPPGNCHSGHYSE